MPPTIDDLADVLSLSRSTANDVRRRLRDKGLVVYGKGSRRSTRVIADGSTLASYGLAPGPGGPAGPTSRRARLGGRRAVLRPGGRPADGRVWPLLARPPRTLPVAGRAAAGALTPFARDDDVLEVDAELAGSGTYALRVSGDSMLDLGIFDGDQVVVDPEQPAGEGDFVAVLIPSDDDIGVATLKLLTHRDGCWWLTPGNPAYAAIPLGDAEVIGRVTTVVRRV
jgi:SOS-response transcriptional repressor LexA